MAGMVLHYGGDPITVDLLWDPTREVPQILDSYVEEDLWTRLAYGNERIAFQFFAEGGQAAYGHYPYDHRGSAIPNGYNLVASDGYDPYGTPNTDLGALMGEYFTPGYRGEFHIDSLIHLRNRDYDPATGTFTTPDPLDSVDGTPTVANAYRYTDNDPLNRTDPLGLRTTDTDAAFVGPGVACGAHVTATRTQRAPGPIITAGGCLASVGRFLAEALTVATASTTAGGGLLQDPQGDEQTALERPREGMAVYRVYGPGAGAGEFGRGWSPTDPRSIGPDGYRDVAGLPDDNPGTHLVIGELVDTSAVTDVRRALRCGPPYCNDKVRPGGLTEFVIPTNRVAVINRSYATLSPPY
jgi:RHS repeat-associated protein